MSHHPIELDSSSFKRRDPCLHKRFTDEQVRVLFQNYCRGKMSRADIQEMLDIGKSRFFVLLKEYLQNPKSFSIAYERRTTPRLSAEIEKEIKIAVLREKEIRPAIFLSIKARMNGSWTWAGKDHTYMPIHEVEITNTAGKGDALFTALLISLAAGLKFR